SVSLPLSFPSLLSLSLSLTLSLILLPSLYLLFLSLPLFFSHPFSCHFIPLVVNPHLCFSVVLFVSLSVALLSVPLRSFSLSLSHSLYVNVLVLSPLASDRNR